MLEYSDGFLGPVRCEDHVLLVRDKHTCDSGQARYGTDVLIVVRVDYVHRVIHCVSHVDRTGLSVDGGVVESAVLLVYW